MNIRTGVIAYTCQVGVVRDNLDWLVTPWNMTIHTGVKSYTCQVGVVRDSLDWLVTSRNT